MGEKPDNHFNYALDKLLKMHWCYFLLSLNPCVFHAPSCCVDYSVSGTIMLLFTFIQIN